jgi:AGCS family alanine or glycine:cation symporter
VLVQINEIVAALNAALFSEVTIFALLATGVLFTIWTRFGQLKALTHGVAVIRGRYDRRDDPGAINHFQALSAALSATVEWRSPWGWGGRARCCGCG